MPTERHRSTPPPPADVLRRQLRAALRQALKTRHLVAVAALRSALAAIDNAEAPDEDRRPTPAAGHARLAGTVAGLGAGDVERRRLSEADLAGIVAAEISERDDSARTYRRAGRPDRAERLEAEADVLRPYLAPTPP